jgi:CubicO group peptidase (beta-lactamase class C family)
MIGNSGDQIIARVIADLRPMTAQLLSHTAGGTSVHGFPDYPAAGPWRTSIQVLSGSSPANNLPVIVDMIPGLRTRYSGGGTTIAQAAVVAAVG